MKNIRVAINGFGRIGRITFRHLISLEHIDVVAINDISDAQTLAHLLKYDSVHGRFRGTIAVEQNALMVNDRRVIVLSEKDPSKLPWSVFDIDIVVESTGRFTNMASARQHLAAGARKVIISAPAEADVPTIVMGVNDHTVTAGVNIISAASCTTNCLAPMARILDENFGIEKGFMTTIHSYTADQRLHDAPHKDLRRARAAALNIVPTTTGAARAVELTLPQLKGKLDGNAMRVPVADGSITDFTAVLKRETTVQQLNEAMKRASRNSLKGIIEYSDEPLVSTDIIGNPHSVVFDSKLTAANGRLVKLVGWYDNEYGFSARMADLVVLLSRFVEQPQTVKV